MKHSTIIALVGLALLCMTVEARRRKGKGKGDQRNGRNGTIECFGEQISEEKLEFGLTECTKELATGNPNRKEGSSTAPDKSRGRRKPKKNLTCVKLCERKKQGIIDTNGKFSESGASHFIKDIFPQKAQPRIERGISRCAEDYALAAQGFDETNGCKEFRRFEKCLTRAVAKVCALNGGGEKGGKRGGKNRANNNNNGHGRKGKNKGNHPRKQSDEHIDDEDSEIQE